MKRCSFPHCLINVVLLISLNACGGKTSSDHPGSGVTLSPTPTQALIKLETTGTIPTLDRSDTLAGPDTNNNGVRDDIDAYIQNTFQDPLERAAVTQSARSMQSAIVVDASDPDATQAVSRSMTRSVHCMFSRFSGNQGERSPMAIDDKIEAMTANTKARMKAYLAYNQSRNGTTSSIPTGDTCD